MNVDRGTEEAIYSLPVIEVEQFLLITLSAVDSTRVTELDNVLTNFFYGRL